jgi:hypothetical protein
MSPRPQRVSLEGITTRLVWSNMISKAWGKWLIGFTVLMAAQSPFLVVRAFKAEDAAVALVNRSDSGGSFLIPASCDMAGAVPNTHYVVAIGKPVEGRVRRRACYYTESAFRRFFPDRFRNDDPKTYRVQQLTTGLRLLTPESGGAGKFLLASILGPFFLLALGMTKSLVDLVGAGNCEK